MAKKKQTKESFFPESIKEELDKAYKIIEGNYYRDVSKGMDAHKRLHTVDVRVEKEKMIKIIEEMFKIMPESDELHKFEEWKKELMKKLKDKSSPEEVQGR